MTIDGVQLWAWCGMDTLIDAVVTQRLPSRDQVDLDTAAGIRGTFSHHNYFFQNHSLARRWGEAFEAVADEEEHVADAAVLQDRKSVV